MTHEKGKKLDPNTQLEKLAVGNPTPNSISNEAE
jgi:hypothetical protein